MMRKQTGLFAIAISLLLAGAVRSEEPVADRDAEPAPTPVSSDQDEYADTFLPETQRARHWLRKYGTCDCQAPIGLDGPILMEIYLQNGVSQPIAGGFLNNRLSAGWIIQGGGRSLFFNPILDRAWTVDLSIANVCNNGNQPNLAFPFLVPGGVANVRNMNRTYVSAGVGREWYLLGNGHHDGLGWRVGCDLGGRYGTARLDLNSNTSTSGFVRTNDTLGALYVAAHSDFEIPWRCCTWFAGYRMEWDYQWIDDIGVQLLEDNLSNLNMLVTLGVRY